MPQALTHGADSEVLKLTDIVAEEVDFVVKRRWLMGQPERHVYGAPLAALCLSGGGVRSATFCLGVLRALARKGILKKFDYVSTVSGGGFAGAFVSRWAKERGFDEVETDLANDKKFSEPFTPMAHFRRYVAYLTPKLGLIGLDSLAGGTLFLRNLLITWMVILPWIFAISMAPQLLEWVLEYFSDGIGDKSRSLNWLALACALVFAAAYAASFRNRPKPYDMPDRVPDAQDPAFDKFVSRFVLPAFATVLLAVVMVGTQSNEVRSLAKLGNLANDQFNQMMATTIANLLPSSQCSANSPYMEIVGFTQSLSCRHSGLVDASSRLYPQLITFVLAALALLLHAAALTYRYKSSSEFRDKAIAFVGSLTVAVLQVSFGIGTLWLLHGLAARVDPEFADGAAVISLPVILQAAYFASDAIYNALFSRHSWSDMEQEWTGRLTGSMLSLPIAWAILSYIVLWNPLQNISNAGSIWGPLMLTGVTSISGLISFVLTQASKAVENVNKGRQLWKEFGLKWGLAIFLGVFTISIVIQFSHLGIQLSDALARQLPDALSPFMGTPTRDTAAALADVPPHPLSKSAAGALIVITLLGFAFIVDYCANLNKFSLHGIYRNRLSRAFVGAANPSRANREAGFLNLLSSDNVALDSLLTTEPAASGEIPPSLMVVNMAMNIPGSRELSMQERKALPFTMTPLSCGSAALPLQTGEGQFRRSDTYASHETKIDGTIGRMSRHVSLGGAIAISGAAIDPAMGRFGSSAMRLLLALINVRLGVWLGNPGPSGEATYKVKGPTFMIWPLAREFLGLAKEDDSYIHLSDGGHFENLAVYEMLRRRCELIVVVDAGCDPEYLFEDLGALQRLARVDLNAEIKILPADLNKLKDGAKAFTIGSIVYKDNGDVVTGTGMFCYIKPSMAPELQPAIASYKRNSPSFPHETTLNQFFSESQFLAYLMLGESQGEEMAEALRLSPELRLAGWFP